MDIKEKLKELEEQVSVIKDPELRKLAFEKLLNLSNKDIFRKQRKPNIRKNLNIKETVSTNLSKPKGSAKAVSADKNKKSDITLSEKDIRDIKNYFGGIEYKRKDGAMLILKICNYLRTKMHKEEFTSGDVIIIYESMIPLHIKVPLLRHIYQTMINLSLKNRRKMWLENKDNGIFSVSRIGKIHWEGLKHET